MSKLQPSTLVKSIRRCSHLSTEQQAVIMDLSEIDMRLAKWAYDHFERGLLASEVMLRLKMAYDAAKEPR